MKLGVKHLLQGWLTVLAISSSLFRNCQGEIVFDNDLLNLADAFDVDDVRSSDVWADNPNMGQVQYYCAFRNHWTPETHPAEYPQLARWGKPLLFSHTKQYIPPFIQDQKASYGVESLAETTFTDNFETELDLAGLVVNDKILGDAFFINQRRNKENYVYFDDPILVDPEYRLLSALAGMSPTPDWFSPFYFFDTIQEQDRTYWDSFLIRSYPFDAGTDDGKHYTDANRDTDPAENIVRIDLGNTVNDIFLNPTKDRVPYVAEWECQLHVCPQNEPNCRLENWPPPCDTFKFPGCDQPCDPSSAAEDGVCEQCRRESNAEGDIFFKNCCLVGRIPINGSCGEEDPTLSGPTVTPTEPLFLSTTPTKAPTMSLTEQPGVTISPIAPTKQPTMLPMNQPAMTTSSPTTTSSPIASITSHSLSPATKQPVVTTGSPTQSVMPSVFPTLEESGVGAASFVASAVVAVLIPLVF